MAEKKHRGMFFELDYGKDLKLDLKDKKIIAILGKNCRTTPTTIGKLIHASKDSVRYRIKQLIDKDIYRGNIAIINPFLNGVLIHSILVKLRRISVDKEEKLIDYLENHPFIIWVGQTQGAYDFNILMASQSMNHFDKILKELETRLSENIRDIKVINMTKMYSANTVPLEFQKQSGVNTETRKLDSSFEILLKEPYVISEDKQELNMKEILVLKIIANNSNFSFQEISDKTGINPDSVKNIMKDLIRKKIILAFRALINVSFLRYHGYIAYFKLYPGTKNTRRKEFEDFFKESVYTAFGTDAAGSYYDVIVYILAQNPLDFNSFINDIKNKFSDIIEEYDADLILKDYKFTFFPEGMLGPVKSMIVKLGAKFS